MDSCPSPFFIWFTGRTGSTYLCDLLNSHPDIYCRREDFSEILIDEKNAESNEVIRIHGQPFIRRLHCPDGDVEHPSPTETIDYLKRLFSQNYRACGFKLKYPNQLDVYPEVVRQLKSSPRIKLIGLYRMNVLKQAISLCNVKRLRALGIVNSGNSKTPIDLEPFKLDISRSLKHARYFLKCRKQFDAFAAEFEDVLSVTYEDLTGQPRKTFQRLLSFLDVETHDMRSNFKKVTPDKIHLAISNYDELVVAASGTELEKYLDDGI